MKLRRLREKLRRLKTEYKYSDDEEETEKSEMETLKDLKKATEQAIRELQVEAAKADKRKGWFIWKKKQKQKQKNKWFVITRSWCFDFLKPSSLDWIGGRTFNWFLDKERTFFIQNVV